MTVKNMKTIDEIVNRNDYKSLNKALNERVKEIAEIIRKKMYCLQIEELDYYRICEVKSGSGSSDDYLAIGDGYAVRSLESDGEYYFWCRHCWKLEYQSQQDAQNPLAVILNRLSRLEKKLGVYGKENSANRSELPPRPKGQHKKTYQKNIKKYLETEEAVIHTVEAILNKLTGDDLLYEKT